MVIVMVHIGGRSNSSFREAVKKRCGSSIPTAKSTGGGCAASLIDVGLDLGDGGGGAGSVR